VTRVQVIDGDISEVRADALITAINASGMWWGAIDTAIQRICGIMFHKKAAAAMPLRDGQVIFAPASSLHDCSFASVIFVIDELRQPVGNLVGAVLEEADALALKSVSLPTFRTGVMADAYEPRHEALAGMAAAINEFVITSPESCIEEITVVVYENSGDEEILKTALLIEAAG
jgi:O-acetyl-ADP-ribose deacetylase (regulator of RNase III)